MEVRIIDATENPIDAISYAAGKSTLRENVSEKRVESCVKLNHSVTEFADVTFEIKGISRACLAQLTRHRLASYCVESQRYNKYKNLVSSKDWYVIPTYIQDTPLEDVYHIAMSAAALSYEKMLEEGFAPEDARFCLPEATKTSLVMKINCRSLFHFFNLRLDSHAQWEIRNLAKAMKQCLSSYNEQWDVLMQIYDKYKDVID